MLDLLAMHKYFLSAHITDGCTAVDFTMGNGHDTAWLSKAVGASGRVYAFDIQDQALRSTAQLLESEGCPDNVTLIHDSHANVKRYVQEPFMAGVFNLGWLPGADKSVTTRRESTAVAVNDAIDLIDHGGILLIAVYPGHPEGRAEGEMLTEMLSQRSRFQMSIARLQIINSPDSPYFFTIEKK